MGLQLADVENNPLVKETLQVFRDALAERAKGGGYAPGNLEVELENPAFKVMAETDCLDPVSAAVLATEHLAGWVGFDTIEPKLNPDVAEVMKLLHGDTDEGPEALLKSANPLALKLLVVSLTASTTGEEFKAMAAEAPPAELRMAMGEIGGFVTDIVEHITENKSWEILPPKLLDRYLEGVGNVAAATTSKTQKRIMTEAVSELKMEMAKAAAAEIAAQMPPPAPLDPESPFEKLKDNARKFKL